MNSVAKFELHFDKEDLTFKDGEYVTGFLELILTEDLKYKSMIFEMKGNSLICWEGLNGSTSADPSSSDVYREHYMEKCVMLGKVGNFLDKDPILQVGEHMIPFEVRIPKDVTSSFEGQYGRVRYECKGVIERPSSGFKSNKVTMTRKDLVVLATLDLNTIPEAFFKIEICKYKELGLCCTEGSLTIDWVVDKSGFIPTEEILINGSIQNDSKHAVSSSGVSLIMVVEYKFKKRRLIDRVRIASLERGGISTDDVTVWNDRLLVPSCPPSTLRRSRTIDISYELEFKVTLENNPSSPITYTKTVYIGTMMLVQQQQLTTDAPKPQVLAAYPQAAFLVPCYTTQSAAGVVLTSPPRTTNIPGFYGIHNGGFDSFSRGTEDDVPLETRPPPYAPGHNPEEFDFHLGTDEELIAREKDLAADDQDLEEFTRTLCIRGNESELRDDESDLPSNGQVTGDDNNDTLNNCNGNSDDLDDLVVGSDEINLQSFEADDEEILCDELAPIHSSDWCSDEPNGQLHVAIQPPKTMVRCPVVATDNNKLLVKSDKD